MTYSSTRLFSKPQPVLSNSSNTVYLFFFFFFQAEDGIRYSSVTGVQTCALPIFRLDPRHRQFELRGVAVLQKSALAHKTRHAAIDRQRVEIGRGATERDQLALDRKSVV